MGYLPLWREMEARRERFGRPRRWETDGALVQEAREKTFHTVVRVTRGMLAPTRCYVYPKDLAYFGGEVALTPLVPYRLHRRLEEVKSGPEMLEMFWDLGIYDGVFDNADRSEWYHTIARLILDGKEE